MSPRNTTFLTTSALVFAGLTLLVGAIVVIVIAVLTRRPGRKT